MATQKFGTLDEAILSAFDDIGSLVRSAQIDRLLQIAQTTAKSVDKIMESYFTLVRRDAFGSQTTPSIVAKYTSWKDMSDDWMIRKLKKGAKGKDFYHGMRHLKGTSSSLSRYLSKQTAKTASIFGTTKIEMYSGDKAIVKGQFGKSQRFRYFKGTKADGSTLLGGLAKLKGQKVTARITPAPRFQAASSGVFSPGEGMEGTILALMNTPNSQAVKIMGQGRFVLSPMLQWLLDKDIAAAMRKIA